MAEPRQIEELSEEDKNRILNILLHEYENTWTESRETAKGLDNLLGVAAALSSAAIIGGFAAWEITAIGSALVFNVALPLVFLVVLLLAAGPVYSLLIIAEHKIKLEQAITTLVGKTEWQFAFPPSDMQKSEKVPGWGLESWWRSTELRKKYAKARKLKNLGLFCAIGGGYLFAITAGGIRVITAWDELQKEFGWIVWVVRSAPFDIAFLTAIWILFTIGELKKHPLWR